MRILREDYSLPVITREGTLYEPSLVMKKMKKPKLRYVLNFGLLLIMGVYNYEINTTYPRAL